MSSDSQDRPPDNLPRDNPRPKIHIDENGQIYHLLRQEDGSWQYRDIGKPPENITIQHFEQKDPPKDYGKRSNAKPQTKKPFPSRRIVKRIKVMPVEIEGENGAVADPADTKRPKNLSTQQFHALYNAVASASGWWPLADARWDSKSYFAKLEKYVMYVDEMPIGFAALDRNSDGPDTTRIVFVGIMPSMQGYKFGSYLFNFINHMAREGGTEKVVLNTAPKYDVMRGVGKPEQAASKMYIDAGFRLTHTEKLNAQRETESGNNLQQLNLPDYYKDNPSFSKDHLLKELCKEFHCKIPRLPAKAKERA